jgi:bacterioferritin-associated ferredoxin
MIVCICKVVTDTQIKKAIADGANTLEELQFDLSVCMQCGKCEDLVQSMLNDHVKVHYD